MRISPCCFTTTTGDTASLASVTYSIAFCLIMLSNSSFTVCIYVHMRAGCAWLGESRPTGSRRSQYHTGSFWGIRVLRTTVDLSWFVWLAVSVPFPRSSCDTFTVTTINSMTNVLPRTFVFAGFSSATFFSPVYVINRFDSFRPPTYLAMDIRITLHWASLSSLILMLTCWISICSNEFSSSSRLLTVGRRLLLAIEFMNLSTLKLPWPTIWTFGFRLLVMARLLHISAKCPLRLHLLTFYGNAGHSIYHY